MSGSMRGMPLPSSGTQETNKKISICLPITLLIGEKSHARNEGMDEFPYIVE